MLVVLLVLPPCRTYFLWCTSPEPSPFYLAFISPHVLCESCPHPCPPALILLLMQSKQSLESTGLIFFLLASPAFDNILALSTGFNFSLPFGNRFCSFKPLLSWEKSPSEISYSTLMRLYYNSFGLRYSHLSQSVSTHFNTTLLSRNYSWSRIPICRLRTFGHHSKSLVCLARSNSHWLSSAPSTLLVRHKAPIWPEVPFVF